MDCYNSTNYHKDRGHLHPNTIIQNDLEFFYFNGFLVLDGPELKVIIIILLR